MSAVAPIREDYVTDDPAEAPSDQPDALDELYDLSSRRAALEAELEELAEREQVIRTAARKRLAEDIREQISAAGFSITELAQDLGIIVSAPASTLTLSAPSAGTAKRTRSDAGKQRAVSIYELASDRRQVYKCGKFPRWMLNEMQIHGYDPTDKDSVALFKAERMVKVG